MWLTRRRKRQCGGGQRNKEERRPWQLCCQRRIPSFRDEDFAPCLWRGSCWNSQPGQLLVQTNQSLVVKVRSQWYVHGTQELETKRDPLKQNSRLPQCKTQENMPKEGCRRVCDRRKCHMKHYVGSCVWRDTADRRKQEDFLEFESILGYKVRHPLPPKIDDR